MCEWGNEIMVGIHIPGSHRRRLVAVDRCIADIVQALNVAGVVTDASCCGHGKTNGSILLSDGRVIEIYPDRDAWERLAPSADVSRSQAEPQDGGE